MHGFYQLGNELRPELLGWRLSSGGDFISQEMNLDQNCARGVEIATGDFISQEMNLDQNVT